MCKSVQEGLWNCSSHPASINNLARVFRRYCGTNSIAVGQGGPCIDITVMTLNHRRAPQQPSPQLHHETTSCSMGLLQCVPPACRKTS